MAEPTDTPITPASKARGKRHVEEVIGALQSPAVPGVSKKRKGIVAPTNPLDVYRGVARWACRAFDPFLNMLMIFRVGIQMETISTGADTGDDEDVNAMSEGERERNYSVYKKILSAAPTLRSLLDSEDFLQDPDSFWKLAQSMNSTYNQARSDDIKAIRYNGIAWIAPGVRESPTIPVTPNSTKSERGFKHILTAKLLCPHRYSAAYEADPEGTRKKLEVLQIKASSKVLPAFLYGDTPYNPDDILDGLFRSKLIARVFRRIFTGPGSVLEPGKSSRGRQSNSKKNHLTRATPRTIAYSAMQVRFMLSSTESWEAVEPTHGFDYQEFYLKLVNVFESAADSQWTISTVQWYTTQVFLNIPSEAAVSENEEMDDFALMDLQRQARLLAEGTLSQPPSPAPLSQPATPSVPSSPQPTIIPGTS